MAAHFAEFDQDANVRDEGYDFPLEFAGELFEEVEGEGGGGIDGVRGGGS